MSELHESAMKALATVDVALEAFCSPKWRSEFGQPAIETIRQRIIQRGFEDGSAELDRDLEAIDDEGPFGHCHIFGCELAGDEFDLMFYDGEGDESPTVLRSTILCQQHARGLTAVWQLIEADKSSGEVPR